MALICGGVLFVGINTVLTPLMPLQDSDAVVRTSSIYLFRLSLSGVAALLLLFGCIGVHLVQRAGAGVFGAVAFVAAFVGTALVLAVEWSNVFVLRAVARTAPDALAAVGESMLMTIGFASAASLFALGWLLLAVSVWRARILAGWAALAVATGLILIPVLGATPLGVAGAIAGNVVLGVGLTGLGRGVAAAR